jgi:hypothetical protein
MGVKWTTARHDTDNPMPTPLTHSLYDFCHVSARCDVLAMNYLLDALNAMREHPPRKTGHEYQRFRKNRPLSAIIKDSVVLESAVSRHDERVYEEPKF